jgi:hypothetical protein
MNSVSLFFSCFFRVKQLMITAFLNNVLGMGSN